MAKKKKHKKKGYSCMLWTEADNQILRDNFCELSNEELGAMFSPGRTEDAVRKQLNKLKLRRPKKSELKELERKAGKNPFFSSLSKGRKLRKEHEDKLRKQEKELKQKEKEREWARKVHGIGAEEKPKQRQPESEEGKVWITLNDRTRMLVPRGKEDFYRAKFDKYEANKFKP